MVAEAAEKAAPEAPELYPGVYFAGPIDYVEHRSPGDHLRDNWRHRFFGDLPINLLCPTCLNEPTSAGPRHHRSIMDTNGWAVDQAEFFVAYFPGDAATFGTPIELWNWATGSSFLRNLHPGILVHPATPGVFVRTLMDRGVMVMREFEPARDYLRMLLRERMSRARPG